MRGSDEQNGALFSYVNLEERVPARHPLRVIRSARPHYPGRYKGYDTEDLVNEVRSMNVTPHVAAKVAGSAVDRRTTRHAGYATSQRIRKRIEEAFGWSKTIGPVARTMLGGLERVGAQFTFTLAGYDLARLPKLLAA
jgi:hypothetical protein